MQIQVATQTVILQDKGEAVFYGENLPGSHSDYLIDVDQKIPDWLIEIMLLKEVETAIRSGIKSRFAIMSFSASDTIWSLWFSL